MGEARRRANNDPSFGKPKRGLIISAPIEIDGESILVKSSNPDLQELRSSLLYWDKLAWPTNSAIFIDGGPEIDFLSEAGVLTRPHFSMSGFGADILIGAQAQALKDLDQTEAGVWSIAQGENSLLLKGRHLVQDGGIAVELYGAIPVPDKDVPLNEVLEFRLKRHDELTSLRQAIDLLVYQANSSDDPRLELKRCLEELDKKCAAAIRVGSEWQFPVKLSNLKTSIDLKPFSIARDALIAYGAATLGVTSALVATLVGASAASSIKISGDFGWKGLRERSNPYRYVSQFHKELF